MNKSDTNDNKFLLGVATSAFQIEGDIQNDMTEWEKDGKFRKNGKNPEYSDGIGHWKRWKDDFLLLKKLNVNAYRFSMEWSRIEPDPGRFDQKALDQYSRMIDRLLELNIIPMLTLHHFTHPAWFHKKSPWHQKSSAESFLAFTQKITDYFADRVSLFITFNEPIVWLLAAYGDARFPPGEKSFDLLVGALKNMMISHCGAYDMIKSANPNSEIGIAKNFILFQPERKWHLLDRGISFLIHNFYNLTLLNAFRNNRLKFNFPFLLKFDFSLPLKNKIDFWGINYYYRLHIRFYLNFKMLLQLNFLEKSGEGKSDLSWEIYSKGLWKIMKWVYKTGRPFYITENGIADKKDIVRKRFLESHLFYVKKALKMELPLKGYFHWSLADNYEWLEGKAACFGLYKVDYHNHLERKMRQSGQFYADFLSKNKPTTLG